MNINTPTKCYGDADKNGRLKYSIKCHLTGKVVPYRSIKKHLRILNLTYDQYLKSFNNIDYLGKCDYCDSEKSIRSIVNGSRVVEDNLRYDHMIYPTCRSKSCVSNMNNIRNHETMKSTIVDGKSLDQLRCEKIVETKQSNGTFSSARKLAIKTMKSIINEDGVSKFSLSRSLANRNAAKNGNLPRSHRVTTSCSSSGEVLHFDSKTEMKFYLKYRRFLSKYYNRDSVACTYEFESTESSYIADYTIKDEFSGKYPDIIEVKNGNLTRSFRRDSIKRNEPLRNYFKFKTLIEDGKKILVADYSRTNKFILIESMDKLDEVFSNVLKRFND